MQHPITKAPSYKKLEYARIPGKMATETGQIIMAQAEFYKPGHERPVGRLTFHPVYAEKDEYAFPKQFLRMSPQSDQMQELFDFSEKGKVIRYVRSVRVETPAGVQVETVGSWTADP